MGTKFYEVLCYEHGIGGSGDYLGDNDALLDIISVFYHEASGCKYVPHAVLFVLKPGMIDAVRASPLGCLFRPGNFVGKTGPKTSIKS
jgi:tubulin beta